MGKSLQGISGGVGHNFNFFFDLHCPLPPPLSYSSFSPLSLEHINAANKLALIGLMYHYYCSLRGI